MGSGVEVALDIIAGVAEEVDEGTLLDEVVLRVDADVLKLLLGVDQVLGLSLLGDVVPLVDALGPLVLGVVQVEVGELWSWHEGVVSHLREADVQGNQVLVVVQQGVPPVVLIVASLERGHNHQLHVEVPDNEATSAATESLVVRGDLLWANSVHQDSHVVLLAEDERVVRSVVRVLVALAELVHLTVVVTRAILLLVLWSLPKTTRPLGAGKQLAGISLTGRYPCPSSAPCARRMQPRSET